MIIDILTFGDGSCVQMTSVLETKCELEFFFKKIIQKYFAKVNRNFHDSLYKVK